MIALLLAAALLAGPSIVSGATGKREHLGQCFTSTVVEVTTRIGIPGSGSSMTLADRHALIDYEQIPALDRSRVGDPVKLCVASLPKHCPKGDTRGIGYDFKNLRTGASRKDVGDSQHMCGGA